MTNTLKMSKFLKYKNILFLGKDHKVYDDIKSSIVDYMKGFDSQYSFYNIYDYSEYDLIIVDIDDFNILELQSFLRQKSQYVPIIYITSNPKLEQLANMENINLKNILLKNLQLNYIIIYILMIINDESKVSLNHGYSYCLNTSRFFFNLKEVRLTRLERKLLELLISNKNSIVPYDEIENIVWGNKRFTIFTMRNIINKIRSKSYPEIIKNISKKGYLLETVNIYK